MHYFLKQAVIQTGDVYMRKEELHVQISADVKKRVRMLIPPIGEIGADEEEESDEHLC